MKVLNFSFILLVSLNACWCKDLVIGTSKNAELVWQYRAELRAFPFFRRSKDFFYFNPDNKLIKGILIRDLEHTDSTATVTAGGVDFSYANVRLESKRGEGLNYQLEMYV